MEKYVVGIDVGTTGTKAMVVDLKGNTLGSGYREYPFIHPESNWIEVNADYVIEQTFDAIHEAVSASGVDSNHIVSVSISVQRSTFALLDAELKPIGNNFIVWLDPRAESVMGDLRTLISPERRAEITGMPDVYVLAANKLYWLKKNRPETLKSAHYFTTVDGYLTYRLGADVFGLEVTNTSVCGLIDVRTLDWCWELIDALGFDRALFPPLFKPGQVIGRINTEIAARTGLTAGTLIVAGTGDQQAGAVGSGIIEDGAVSLTLGTVAMMIVGLSKPDFVSLNGLLSPSTPALGIFEVEGNQNSGATCYRWARDTLCSLEANMARDLNVDPYVLMEHYIDQSCPGCNGTIFYAALFGTGYPTWNSEASGTFVGLKPTTTKADMVRAIMEGITLESRFMLESIQGSNIKMKDSITINGGATKSEAWRQIIADIMGRPVRTLNVADASIIGDACIAAIGAGLFRNLEEAVDNMVHFEDTIQPIPENVNLYNKIYEIYKKTYTCLNEGGVFTMLSSLSD